jgi:putative ABC transport system permease protein
VLPISMGVRVAFGALRENKLRTFLTLLGNIVGVMSVIAVVSILDGLDRYVLNEFASLGTDTLRILRVDPFAYETREERQRAWRQNPRLELADVGFLERRLNRPGFVGAEVEASSEVVYRDQVRRNVTILGRTGRYPFIDNYELDAGRHFLPLEVERSRPVAFLGSEVARELFQGQNPLGKRIRIGNRHLDVVGVAAERPNLFGMNQNQFVVIPVSTFRKIYGPDVFESLSLKVRVSSPEDLARTEEQVEAALRTRHGLRAADPNDFGIFKPEDVIRMYEDLSNRLFSGTIVVVSISLLVGGIVLMNIMLVSVRERTREIGIRKALGARRVHITWQFLLEAVTLSLTGGAIGIVLGFGIGGLVSVLTPLPFAMRPWAVGLGVGVTFVIGIVFGTLPAVQAARLNPVEALRHE